MPPVTGVDYSGTKMQVWWVKVLLPAAAILQGSYTTWKVGKSWNLEVTFSRPGKSWNQA